MDHGNPWKNFAAVCEPQQFYREMGGTFRVLVLAGHAVLPALPTLSVHLEEIG